MGNVLYSQNKTQLRELWASYNTEKNKVEKSKKLNFLAQEYLGFNIDSAIIISKKSKEISSYNSEEQISANLILSKAYIRLGQITKAIDLATKTLSQSSSTHYIEGKIKSLNLISLCHFKQNRKKQAIDTTQNSLFLSDSINNTSLKYESTLYLAQFITASDIQKAEKLNNEVYQKIKDSTDYKYLDLRIHALRNKEVILFIQDEFKLRKTVCEEALSYLKGTNNIYQSLYFNSAIGGSHRSLGNYQESQKVLLNAEALASKHKFNWLNSDIKSILGILEMLKGNNEKAISYEEEALRLIEKYEDADFLKMRIFNYTGYIYKRKGENIKAINYFKEALLLAEKTENILQKRSALSLLGDSYRISKNYKESLKLYEKIELINKTINNNLDKVYTKLDIGKVYEDQKKYEKAIQTYQAALTLMNELNDKDSKIYTHIKLADCYSKLQKNNSIFSKEALYHYQESIQLMNTTGNTHIYYMEAIVGLGKLLINFDQKKAENYLLEAIELNRNSPNNVHLMKAFSSLAKIAYNKKNYKKALDYYKKALKLKNLFYQEQSATAYHIGLAETYQKLNQKDSSIYYLKTALNTTDLEEKMIAFSAATSIFKNENNYKKALIYSDSIPILKDQFHKENDQTIVDGMLLEMKLTKDLEIEQKKNELKSQQLKSRNYLMIAAFAIAIALLFGLFYFKNNNTKNKLLAKQEQDYRAKQDQLFANLSHEFRTPLTVLKTSIEKIEKTPSSNILLKNTNHLIDLTNQILDISRLSEKKINLNPKPVDVVGLTKQLLEQVQSFSESKNISLKLQASTSVITIPLDKNVYRKILINLVFNAIKFTPENGVIDVSLQFNNNYWKLIIKDNGVGIAPKDIPNLFERYYRAPLSENRSSTGGLGLALTKQLVELVNGTIHVKSELGKGSQFEVSFPNHSPIRPSDNDEFTNHIISGNSSIEIISKTPTSLNIESRHDKNTPTILLIEDNNDLNNIIHSELSNYFKTLSTFNGSEALNILNNEKPDIIITDIMMPVMNGVEFIETIKNIPEFKSIPIIVMSSLEEKHDNMKLWKLGVVDFITKPFDLQVLLFKITNNLKTFQESSNQYKNLKSLTANLIHDLRSPVVTLQMIVNDLLENKKENLDKYLNYINENSNNLLELINGLTEINRIHKRTSYTLFNISDCVNNVLFNLEHLVKKTNAVINQEVENLEITMDKSDFTRILQNLIQNALTYTKEGIYPKIDISIFSKEKNTLSIIIKDNGKGIPENDFNKIFKQLKRGKSSQGTQGTGLGLYIVKEITNKYQGDIKVYSKIKEHTTFSITLTLKSIV